MYLNLRWFFYSIVVIFLGGIIIIFVYASSLRRVFKIENITNNNYGVILLVIFFFMNINFTENNNENLFPVFLFINFSLNIFIYVIFIINNYDTCNYIIS